MLYQENLLIFLYIKWEETTFFLFFTRPWCIMFALHSTQYRHFKMKSLLQQKKRAIFFFYIKLQLLLSLLLRSFLSLAIKGVFYILNYYHYTLLFNILERCTYHSLSKLFPYFSIFSYSRYYTLNVFFSFFFHFLIMLKIHFSSLTRDLLNLS